MFLTYAAILSAAISAQEIAPHTTLENRAVRYLISETGYHVLKRGDVTAVVVDNREVNNDILPGHRAGYSGIASLTHHQRSANLFVPAYAGLNYEHIHDGTAKDRDVLFEPRRQSMELRVINDHTVELYQPPTANWKLESALRYEMLKDGTIEMTLECIPRAKTFRHDYIGLFWASYIHQPESLDIHFRGHDKPDSKNGIGGNDLKTRWIRGITPKHGTLSTHVGRDDAREFERDPDFPLTLVFNRSKHRFDEPWYFGVSHKMAMVLMFRPQDGIRITQSPSGGGNGNPAWDFQFFIPNYKVGQRYRMVMRAQYVPFESNEQIERMTSANRKALGHDVRQKDAEAPSVKRASDTRPDAVRTNLIKAGAKLTVDDSNRVTGISFLGVPVEAKSLSLLKHLSQLVDLNLYESRVGDAQVAEIRNLQQLQSLNLGFCEQLTDQSLDTISELVNLRVLNLGFCRRMTDTGLLKLSRLTKLETLNLSITAFSNKSVAALDSMKSLRVLDIDNTRVDDEGIEKIARHKTLWSIRMVGVQCHDESLLKLARLPKLRHINLRDVPVSEAAIRTFRDANPNCTVKR